jgi:N-acetylglucosamine kinase-like BadF-type ATPase
VTDFFLGCDGGGTKTALAVITDEGTLAASLHAPTTYYLSSQAAGIAIVGEVLGDAVPAVCAQAGIAPDDLGYAFFGLPGYGEVRADIATLDAAAGSALGHDRFRCDNDMVCGWAGSLGGADGINVISGTGSMTYGRRREEGLRVGGWGELFGDEGSGYWIGVRALRAFSKMSDGRADRGPLHGVLTRALEIDTDIEAVELVLHRWHGARRPIAALSRAVGEAARAGDACAHTILADAAAELVGLVEATRRRLGFEPDELVPVSYSGGVFAMPEVQQGFVQGIAAIDARYEVRTPLYPPVVGAALYAATLAGRPLGADALQRLRSVGD